MQRFVFAVVATLLVTALATPAASRAALSEAALRNAVDDALDQVRDIILNGDPENGIPVLDPLVIENQEISIDEEQLQAEGSLSSARFTGLGAFEVKRSSLSIGIIPPRATINVAINFGELLGVGNYQVSGRGILNGATVPIQGDGAFTLKIRNFFFSTRTVVNAFGYTVRSCEVTLDLGEIFVEVTGAGDLGDLINAEAAERAEQWFWDHRTEIESKLVDIITQAVESSSFKSRLEVAMAAATAA